MNAISYTTFKTNIETVFSNIVETNQPMMVKKNRKSTVVVMPLQDYQALTETRYLLSSSVNADRLMQGIAEVEAQITKS
jgi:antitoxin YefM